MEDYVSPGIDMNWPNPLLSADQQMRMEAVQRAVELYANKQAPHLDGYNESFKKLYTEIYQFYVNNKELH